MKYNVLSQINFLSKTNSELPSQPLITVFKKAVTTIENGSMSLGYFIKYTFFFNPVNIDSIGFYEPKNLILPLIKDTGTKFALVS